MAESISSADSSLPAKNPDIAQQKSRRWQSLYLWWYSLPAISFLSTIARWSIAVVGVFVLVLGMRQSRLQDQAKANEKATNETEKRALNKKIAETESKATQANMQVAEASAKQAQLEQQNLALRGDLDKLQTLTKSRQITEEQKARLLKLLTPVPKALVLVSCISGDQEAYSFAGQLCAVLKAAKFNTKGPTPVLVAGGRPTPILGTIKDAQRVPGWLVTLDRALTDIGFPVEWRQNANMSDTVVEILVGARPIPQI